MSFTVSLEHGVGVFVGYGVFDADDAMRAMAEWYRKHPTRLVLYDLRQLSMSGFSAGDFERVARFGEQFLQARGARPRTAYVLRDNVADRYLMSAYRARLSQVSRLEHRQFCNYDEAMAWLMSANDQAAEDPPRRLSAVDSAALQSCAED